MTLPDQWIFASPNSPGGEESFSEDSQVTSGLDEVLFPIAGYVEKRDDSKFEFHSLVSTGILSGTIADEAYRRSANNPDELIRAQGRPTDVRYTVAAHIQGPLGNAAATEEKDNEDSKEDGDKKKPKELNVIYVADLDLLSPAFLNLRARPDQTGDVEWQFENVTFLLNIFDELTGDTDYIRIRKRKPSHHTLKIVEKYAEMARTQETSERATFDKEYEEELEKRREEINVKLKTLQKQMDQLQKDPNADRAKMQAIVQTVLIEQERANRRVAVAREQLERTRDRKIRDIRRRADAEISAIQNRFKLWAIVVPPLPPLLLGILVLVIRLLREREGVAKTRLR